MIIPLLARSSGWLTALRPAIRPLLDTFDLLTAIVASRPSSSLLIATAPTRHDRGRT